MSYSPPLVLSPSLPMTDVKPISMSDPHNHQSAQTLSTASNTASAPPSIPQLTKTLSPPISPIAAGRSPRTGNYPVNRNPAVHAYHQNLSSHLHSLIRTASGQTNGLSPPPNIKELRPISLVETGRKRSDESYSLSGTSQRGSFTTGGDTRETRSFGNFGPSASSSTGCVASAGIGGGLHGLGFGGGDSVNVSDEEVEGEEIEDGEIDGQRQFTARPELVPRRSLMHVPSRDQIRVESSSTSPDSREEELEQLAFDPDASRENELQTAWKADGNKVWRTMPDGFQLKMDREDLSGTGKGRERMKRASRERLRADGVGLGIGIISDGEQGEDHALPGQMARLRIARKDVSTSLAQADSARNSSNGRNTIRPTRLAPDNTEPAKLGTGTRIGSGQSATSSSRIGSSRRGKANEQQEYEAKRLAKLGKKRGELESRVRSWNDIVALSSTDEENEEIFRSDIIPTPPSPRTTLSPPKSPFDNSPGNTVPALPFSAVKAVTFNSKQQPLYLIPPTPDRETPPILSKQPSQSSSRSHSFARSGVDLQAKLRILEAMMGAESPPPVRQPHPESFYLSDPAQLGEGTIRGRRTSLDVTVEGGEELEVQTPRPGRGGLLQ